jgi:hypothetical protein
LSHFGPPTAPNITASAAIAFSMSASEIALPCASYSRAADQTGHRSTKPAFSSAFIESINLRTSAIASGPTSAIAPLIAADAVAGKKDLHFGFVQMKRRIMTGP